MSRRMCCSQGWEQGQVISRANRSSLICRLQLMGTEAVSDEQLVPRSWEVLEDVQGVTLFDSHFGSVLPWGEFGCGVPRKGQHFAIFCKFSQRFSGQALERKLWDEGNISSGMCLAVTRAHCYPRASLAPHPLLGSAPQPGHQGACSNAWQGVWCSERAQPLLLWLPESFSKSQNPQVAVWLPAAPT